MTNGPEMVVAYYAGGSRRALPNSVQIRRTRPLLRRLRSRNFRGVACVAAHTLVPNFAMNVCQIYDGDESEPVEMKLEIEKAAH
jgi:hypothetical protein